MLAGGAGLRGTIAWRDSGGRGASGLSARGTSLVPARGGASLVVPRCVEDRPPRSHMIMSARDRRQHRGVAGLYILWRAGIDRLVHGHLTQAAENAARGGVMHHAREIAEIIQLFRNAVAGSKLPGDWSYGHQRAAIVPAGVTGTAVRHARAPGRAGCSTINGTAAAVSSTGRSQDLAGARVLARMREGWSQ